jgi:eukaryotic-like serine/threonine-protein kinase
MTQQSPAKLIAQRYSTRALIGQGGMGAVYLADDLQMRHRVALKVIRPEFSSDPRTRRRFNKESRAFAYLKHPNIVEVYDFGQDAADGTLYLAMELVKGYSLRVLRHVELPLFQIVHIIDQLLGALAHAHARGVIHRDLKPENVLVTQADDDTNPIVKLVDFGLASLPTMNEMSHTGSILGTPSYMAPEQARGPRGVVGPSTDIYAVGVILYELLCDRLPFEADNQVELILKHVQQPVPPLRPRDGITAPDGLEAVIQRAMAKKPWDRFVNAAEFRRALKAVDVPFEAMPLLEPPDDAPWLLPEDASSSARANNDPSRGRLTSALGSGPIHTHPSIDVAAVAGSIDAVMMPSARAPTPAPITTPPPALSTPSPQSGVGFQRLARPRSGRWRSISSQSIPALSVSAVAEHIPTPPINAASAPFNHTSTGELIGRDAEVALLDGIAQRVLLGQGQVVLIEGEQGVGKSGLARALLHRFTETGTMRAALGVYTATEGGGPGAGIRGAIESLFNTANSDRATMEQQARGVLERLGIHDPRDQREITLFLRPLSAEDGLAATLSEDAVQRQRSRLALVQRLLRLVAQEMPLVMLFEDIHWATDGVMGFLESMINAFRVQQVPCLLMCTLTNAELDPAGMVAEGMGRLVRFTGQGLQQVHLGRLTREQSLALIQRMSPTSTALAEQLSDRAGGNPLYTIQMLQSLQQDRQLVLGEGGQWRVADGVSLDSVLPSSVAEVLRRRLQRSTARLGSRGDAYLQILIRAAVLGSACEVTTLEAYLQLEADEVLLPLFDDALDAWVQNGILREVRDRNADVFEFDHPLLRDVLLESIPRRKLRRLHLHAANLKRDRFYPVLAPVASDISEHYQQAGEVGLAAEYTLMAARHHETTGQFRQAIALYERLHQLYESSTGDFSQLIGRGVSAPRAPSSQGLPAAGQQHTPPSGTHALALDWSEVWLGLGRVAIAQGALDRAQAFSDQMQRYGEQHQQMLPQAKAQWLMARVSTRRSDLVDAWERYNLARDLFEAEQDMNGVPLCLWGMGEVARLSGWLEDARNYVTSAMGAFEDNERPSEVAACQLALGNIAFAGGLLTTARTHYARAQETFTGLSDLYHVHHSQLGLALVSLALGQVKDSFQQLTTLSTAFANLGDRHGLAHCQLGLARALMEARDYDRAAALLEEAFASFQQLSDPKSASHVQRLQAMLMRWRGSAAQAIHYIGQAAEHFSRTQDRQGIGACFLERAWIALELGDPNRASEHLEQANEHYNLSGDVLGVTACAELCAHIEFARASYTRALEYVHQGLDLTEQTGASPIRAHLLACGVEVCAHLLSWSEMRTLAAALDALQLDPHTVGAPQFARSLRACAEVLGARASLEPDIRQLQRRFEQLSVAAEAGATLPP